MQNCPLPVADAKSLPAELWDRSSFLDNGTVRDSLIELRGFDYDITKLNVWLKTLISHHKTSRVIIVVFPLYIVTTLERLISTLRLVMCEAFGDAIVHSDRGTAMQEAKKQNS